MYPYGCCKETSDKVVLVYKSNVSNTILFKIIAEGPLFANFVQYAFANNADDDGIDRLFKIRHVVETVISNFRETFTPYQNIAT